MHQPHPWTRALGLVAVVLLGAWLGLLIVGNVRAPVGPMDTTMTLRPSLTGGTKINVSPLGALELSSHTAPVRLDVNVDQLDPVRSQALVDHPERLSGLQDEVAQDVEPRHPRPGRALLRRRRRPAPPPSASRSTAARAGPSRPAASRSPCWSRRGATAYATWNPKSVLEPKFSGLLSSAPSLVGNARSIVTEFDVYQKELARLVTNVTKLYDVTSTLPTYQPDPATIRVLHVSDIHLNPASWKIIALAGGAVRHRRHRRHRRHHGPRHGRRERLPGPDQGSGRPVRLGARQPRLAAHPALSAAHEERARPGRRPVGHRRRAALRGHRRPGSSPRTARRAGRTGGPDQEAGGRPAGVGPPRPADRWAPRSTSRWPTSRTRPGGRTAWCRSSLAGHLHHAEMEVMPKGTRLRVEGSTGGSGLRARGEAQYPDQIEASVLYLDRDTRRLQAWDEIKLGGLGLTTAEVSRHLPKENQPGATPASPSPLRRLRSLRARPRPSP